MSFIVKQQHIIPTEIPACIQRIEYKLADYNPKLFLELLPESHTPKSFNQWVLQRQAQFLAGRLAAKYALQAINYPPKNITIGKHREPLWPKNIIGSISHSENTSIATALHLAEATKGCGLDIQTLFNHEESAKTLPLILSQQDQPIFKHLKKCFAENQLETLIFSAKESYFKAVFNQVKTYFDFNAVSIQSIDLQNKQLTLISNDNTPIQPRIALTVHYDFLLISNKQGVMTYSIY